MPPKILQKSCQRRVQDGMKNHDDFLLDFDALWTTKMVPCWAYVDAQDGTKNVKKIDAQNGVAKKTEMVRKKNEKTVGAKAPQAKQPSQKLY